LNVAGRGKRGQPMSNIELSKPTKLPEVVDAAGGGSAPHAHEAATHLHGRALLIARTAWVVFVVFDLIVFGVAIVATYDASLRQGSTTYSNGLAQLGMTAEAYAVLSTGIALGGTLISLGIAIFLFLSRSDDWMVLLVSFVFIALAPGTEIALSGLADTEPAWLTPVELQFAVGLIAVMLLLFTFPTGRFVPAWTRLALALYAVLVVASLSTSILLRTPVSSNPGLVICYSMGFVAQFQRYRSTTSPVQRQQFRWIVFGFLIYAPIFVTLFLLNAFVVPTMPDAQRILFELWGVLLLFYVPAILLFITAVFATLRYRLFDIDLIIHRTLVYVPLTALLAGIFAASITGTQKLFVALTGQESDAATVLTTLIVVIAFTPIKDGLQNVVNKRFKAVPDPAKKLAAFRELVDARVSAVDPPQVMRRFLQEAASAFGAKGGEAYLEQEGVQRQVCSIDSHTGNMQVNVSLDVEGRHVGALMLGPRQNGADYGKWDYSALEETAATVAQAIVAARKEE
jgi:hypothetical protein